MRTFRWLSANPVRPACDLRRCGWKLIDGDGEEAGIGLAHVVNLEARDWLVLLNPPNTWQRRSILLTGVDAAEERARLLRLGFGEVLGEPEDLAELEARALRVAEQSSYLPNRRTVGPLTLDLFARDGLHDRTPLGLHPREFALLWRLAETPGSYVAKRTLLADVWRLRFVPETNSLAVHIFRLRSKLATAGLSDIIRSDGHGGYALVIKDGQTASRVAPVSPNAEPDRFEQNDLGEEQHDDA